MAYARQAPGFGFGVARRRLLSSGAALIPGAVLIPGIGAAAAASAAPAAAAEASALNDRGSSGAGRIGKAGAGPRAEALRSPTEVRPFAPGMPTARVTTLEHWSSVAEAFGRPGNLVRGTYYHTAFPRWDLDVESQGVRISAGLALSSHASFAAYNDGDTLLMGDLVVPEQALQDFLEDLLTAGIMVTAVHKHLLAQTPELWWVHACATGPKPVQTAQALRLALTRAGTPPPVAHRPAAPALDLDTAGIDAALGARGNANGEVYTTVFVRREAVVDGGRLLPEGLGSTTAVNFQPLGRGRAAVNGDFVMTADEVTPALTALRRGGLQVAALHNHGLTDEPRLFFTHFWAVDDAVRTAAALHGAISLTAVRPAA